jgi:SpoVK/Ycf46/Vps4 family AAA+-type ATPase
MADGLFQGEDAGNEGTHNVVLQSADYDSGASRQLEFLDDDYYCSPHFMDKVTLHLVKNYLADILPKIKIPLILGVWGGKGQGKTFQAELIFKKLNMEPVVMSAGELESGNAGEPAKLIRQRYREAADLVKKGTMTSLFINDLDAGAGRMGGSTQYTVNNQLVNATLMNIADNPTNVQLPGQYNQEEINRVPVVATGNDFSTLYAPLIRDGRMEKFYWSPTRDDRVGVVMGIFKDDGVDQKAAEVLVDTFQGQTIDFFGALRSRIYDDKIREFVENTGFEKLKKRLTNPSYEERNKTFEKPDMSLQTLLAYGRQLEQEQENVRRVQLADEYMYSAGLGPEESREAEGALLG